MKKAEEIYTKYLAPLSGASGCCDANEYRAILEHLTERAPCRLLVFGCGNDSAAWLAANEGGQTLFLEDSLKWAREVEAAQPDADIVVISVTARPERWRFNLNDLRQGGGETELALDLPDRVRETAWDFVIVDGPMGEIYGGAGRQSSLFEASRLAAPNSIVCVHDADRPLEGLFCQELFDSDWNFRCVGRLRIYQTTCENVHTT